MLSSVLLQQSDCCIREQPGVSLCHMVEPWGEGCPGCLLVPPISYCPAGALVKFFWDMIYQEDLDERLW